MKPTQDPTYPVDSGSPAGFAPRQPVAAAHPPPPFQAGPHIPYPQQMAQQPLPPHMVPQRPYSGPQAYPYGQPMGYPQAQAWQMPPQPGYPYPQAAPAPNAGQMPYPDLPASSAHPHQPTSPRHAARPHEPLPEALPAAEDGEQQTPIEEIRDSLREFREAVRELTETRARRRYF